MTATTKTRSTRLPTTAQLKRLKLSPEVAWYMLKGNRLGKDAHGNKVCKPFPLPKYPPKVKTPEPRWVKGAEFDPERVDRVLRAFHVLRHTQGDWAGQPLDPDSWQVAYILAPTFGWVKFVARINKWVRIIRELYVDVPRKNGKTTLIGGISMYMLAADGEMGAQCLTAATNKEQAGFVFEPVKLLAQSAPGLKGNVKAFAARVVHKRSGSYFQPIANIANAQHGANIHLGCVDELHLHKDDRLVTALETGTGARSQPLMVWITTADDGSPATIYARKRDMVEKLAKGIFKNPGVYGVIWAADKTDNPFTEVAWKKANPGYGVSPTPEYLEFKATSASQSPVTLADFLRLHLGIRAKQAHDYIPIDIWDASAGMVVEGKLAGRLCHGGIDLSTVEDISALCWEFPDEQGGFDVLWRFFLPREQQNTLSLRTAKNSDQWIKDGFITLTPGNVIDLDQIFAQVKADAKAFDVQTVGFDRWGANPLVTKIGDLGYTCVPRGQGFATTSAPMKDIKRLTLLKKYRHGGNPVMRWMNDNLAVSTDAAGNVKPDKASCPDKIDGWSAAVNAHGEYMDNAAAKEPEPDRSPPQVLERADLLESDYASIETAGF